MEQQRFFQDSVYICRRKPCGSGGIMEYTLSNPDLLLLRFRWKEHGAYFHLYRRAGVRCWMHVAKADTLPKIMEEAQEVKTANPSIGNQGMRG